MAARRMRATRAHEDATHAEFDTVAEWTAQVAMDLGPDYYVPAGCRGSGSPAALDWLIDGMRLAAGRHLAGLRCGCRRSGRVRGAIMRRAAGSRRARTGSVPGRDEIVRLPGACGRRGRHCR